MLIAISGAQGSGKSTLLNELTNFGCGVVERKTARSVLEQFKVKTLDEVYADPDLVVQWQEQILVRKVADEFEAYTSHELWFTERTYADLFTYACMAVGKNNKKSAWLNDYFEKCKEYQNKYYIHSIFVEHHGHFSVVDDGVRGINQHYATMIGTSLRAFLSQMTDEVSTIGVGDVNSRVKDTVTISLNKYLEKRDSHDPDIFHPEGVFNSIGGVGSYHSGEKE